MDSQLGADETLGKKLINSLCMAIPSKVQTTNHKP